MTNQFIKRLLVIAFVTVTTIALASCGGLVVPSTKEIKETVTGTSHLNDEWLSNEVSHGLHKITLDDSTTILIYRGVESCAMIQIK